jgi:hypothetical protein
MRGLWVELLPPRHPARVFGEKLETQSRSAIRVMLRKEQVLRFQPRSERVDGVQFLLAVSCFPQPAYHIVSMQPFPALVFTRIGNRFVDRANCPGRFGKRMNVPSWFSPNSQGGMDKKIAVVRHELKMTHPCKRFRNLRSRLWLLLGLAPVRRPGSHGLDEIAPAKRPHPAWTRQEWDTIDTLPSHPIRCRANQRDRSMGQTAILRRAFCGRRLGSLDKGRAT